MKKEPFINFHGSNDRMDSEENVLSLEQYH